MKIVCGRCCMTTNSNDDDDDVVCCFKWIWKPLSIQMNTKNWMEMCIGSTKQPHARINGSFNCIVTHMHTHTHTIPIQSNTHPENDNKKKCWSKTSNDIQNENECTPQKPHESHWPNMVMARMLLIECKFKRIPSWIIFYLLHTHTHTRKWNRIGLPLVLPAFSFHFGIRLNPCVCVCDFVFLLSSDFCYCCAVVAVAIAIVAWCFFFLLLCSVSLLFFILRKIAEDSLIWMVTAFVFMENESWGKRVCTLNEHGTSEIN